jgi:hypothetical protein
MVRHTRVSFCKVSLRTRMTGTVLHVKPRTVPAQLPKYSRFTFNTRRMHELMFMMWPSFINDRLLKHNDNSHTNPQQFTARQQ